MTTTADEAAFLTAIARNPEDDNVRLVFADWLEEHPLPDVVCARCSKEDWGKTSHTPEGCERCHGTGTVRDTSRADRAEFIRCQIRQHTISPTGLNIPRESLQEWYELEGRANELQRPEWAKCPCPACEQHDPGRIWHDGGRNPTLCPVCDGHGDLLFTDDDGTTAGHNRTVIFRRGFVDSVECRLSELGEERCRHCRCNADECGERGGGCMYCDGGLGRNGVFTPSPWARAVVTTLPVTRLRVVDKSPHGPSDDGLYGWASTNIADRYYIPKPVWEHLRGFSIETLVWKDYESSDAALDALAVAAARAVRRAVYGS